MTINLEYMKPNICPICGERLSFAPIMVQIKLNNQTMMPQPACDKDIEKIRTKEGQEAILLACKAIWLLELTENKQRSEKERINEIKKIKDLKVV